MQKIIDPRYHAGHVSTHLLSLGSSPVGFVGFIFLGQELRPSVITSKINF